MTSLEGVLERIFYNEENGFLIGKLKGCEKEEIAVVGKAPKVQCGETWFCQVPGPCIPSRAIFSILLKASYLPLHMEYESILRVV